MRTTITAAALDILLNRTDPHTPATIRLTATPDGHLTATNTRTGNSGTTTATNTGPWHHELPTTDLPTIHAFLDRFPDHTPIRIGTATLADNTGTLLTLRTGPNAIRLHTPHTGH